MDNTQEMYLREKVALATKVMQDLNDVIERVTPDLQQDLTDTIVDVFNLQEAIHYHIDIHLVLARKVQEARVNNARLTKQNADLKLLLDESNRKLAQALERPL